MSDQVNPSNVPHTDDLKARKPPTDAQLMWLVSLLQHAQADQRALTLLFGAEFTKLTNLSQHAVEWGIHQVLTFLQESGFREEDDPDDLLQPRIYF
jgi:hypothetical protein